jgi:hypothetical protein
VTEQLIYLLKQQGCTVSLGYRLLELLVVGGEEIVALGIASKVLVVLVMLVDGHRVVVVEQG